MTLNQKETTLLKDLLNQEKLCVEKYHKYSQEANDPELAKIFSTLEKGESKHEQMLKDIQSGKVPTVQQPKKKQQSGKSQTQTKSAYTSRTNSQAKAQDAYMCADTLAAEKHVSSVYDTCIFEFRSPELRDVLNSIQKQEQGHGEELYQYMSANGMQGV